MSKDRFVVGFDCGSSTIGGKEIVPGGEIEKYMFPLSLKEAKERMKNHKPFPNEQNFMMFRLVKVKKTRIFRKKDYDCKYKPKWNFNNKT